MPKEKSSLLGMLSGDEPGLIARLGHVLSGGDEGEWGEKCVGKCLENRAFGARIFRNVYVPLGERTAELDLVAADRSGIYVFESKAYGGRIYGRADAMRWTQYLGGKRSDFYNPVRQNASHCRALAKTLQVPIMDIISIIVFENRADLSKVGCPKEDSCFLCRRKHLPQTLREAQDGRRTVFTPEKLVDICRSLESWSHVDAEIKARHIQQARRFASGDVCPLCGGALAERKGRYGAFLGCGNYPKCTYTREISKGRTGLT